MYLNGLFAASVRTFWCQETTMAVRISWKPLSSDPTNWNYKKNTIFDAGSGTVGQMAFADVDGDGYNDIFIPSYNQATVHVYTFAPYIVFG